MRLVCMPPEFVQQFLPFARKYIDAAIERTGLSRASETHFDILAGSKLLWLIIDDASDIHGAVVTDVEQCQGQNLCVIFAYGSDNHKACAHLISDIENYARTIGCAAMRIYGRKGWVRHLPDYQAKAVILEKAL